MRSAPRRALRAKSPENELAFAKNPLAEGTGGRPAHVVPLQILYITAAVTNKVVMPHALGVKSRGTALDGYLPDQTRLDQVPQIVIRGGPGATGIHPIHSFEDFGRGWMPIVFHQERHHGEALRRTPQTAGLQGPFDGFGLHEFFRIYLM